MGTRTNQVWQMRAIGTKVGVVFDENHLKTYNVGGIELLRPESWRAREDDGETMTKTQSNVNHLLTNPQMGWVAMANDNLDYEVGDKIFMHYLAYEEYEEKIEVDGKDVYLVDKSFILFKMKEPYVMSTNTYLGTTVIEEPPKTTSGIFLTSHEAVENELKIIITHTPIPKPNEYGITIENVCKVGDMVVPIDKSNYHLIADGTDYVMLKDYEILGSYAEEN